MHWRLLSTICASLLVVALVTVADAADWRVAQMSGRVYVRQGNVQLASLSEDIVLRNGATIVTERDGRAHLVRGKQSMIVAPNSMVTLPAESGGFTRIVERLGQVEYNVDHRDVRHFSVETPYLAAVVKGTRFQVRVYKGGASVSVLRGRVEVTSLKTGEKVDLLAGQRADVNSAGRLAINGAGTIQPIKQGNARKSVVEPGIRADLGNSGASVGVGVGGATASISAGSGGVSAGIGVGGATANVSAGSGGGGVSANVGGVAASANGGGVAASAGSGVSAGVGSGGISASIGGLSIGN